MGTAAPPLFRRVARPLPPRADGAWRRGRTCRILRAALAFMRRRDVCDREPIFFVVRGFTLAHYLPPAARRDAATGQSGDPKV